tara:strand:+ start:217 stop:765 length:549 start_codon:yes stop_codon:yes gene_type:complete
MMDKLNELRGELKVGKNHFNAFGKYKYRNLEDIMDAVKPLLCDYGLTLSITDEIKEIGGVIFVEATASLTDGQKTIESKAQAGIDVNKKGMDMSQTFGASSSYARKYACNALFLIDDVADADSTNTHGKGAKTAPKTTEKPWLNKDTDAYSKVASYLMDGGKLSDVKKKYKISKEVEQLLIA